MKLSPEDFIPSLMLGVAKRHFDREKFSEAIAMIAVERMTNGSIVF